LFARVAYTRYVNDDAWTCTVTIFPIPSILFVILWTLRRGYSASSLVPALSVGDLLGNEANAFTGTPASPYCLT